MPKFRLVQNNWTSGELTPYLHGRPDFNRYQMGAAKLENFVVLPHGLIVRRSGTVHVTEKKVIGGANGQTFRLIPFIFSEADVFVLEVGHQYIRFYKNGAVVGVPYELASPYTASQLVALDFSQSGNVMYLFHPDVQTRRLIRIDDTNWVFSTLEFYDGPYNKVQFYNDLSTQTTYTMTPSAVGTVGASVNIIVKASLGGAEVFPFTDADIGRYIRIYHSVGAPPVVTWGVGKITNTNVGTPNIVIQCVVPFGAITESETWRISSFYGPDRWPAKGVFHEERLALGRNKDYPNTVWGSVIDDFSNFSPSASDGTVADDHAYSYTLGTGQIDQINWLASNKGLLIGTVAGPYSMTGNDVRTPIGPKAIQASKETNYGASERRPTFMDRATMYISQTRKQMHEMYYSLDVEGFQTPTLSIMAEHLFRSNLEEVYPAEDPYHMVWGYTGNGKAVCLTYMKDHNVIAFTGCPIGGGGKVRALTTVPAADASEIWMIVQREINGDTKYYVEYIDALFVPDEDSGVVKEDAFFLDSGKKITGPTTTITLAHLPNQVVDVLADGNEYLEIQLNGSGVGTIPQSGTKIHAGLRCPAKFRTLPLDIVAPELVSMGMNKSCKKIHVDVMDTVGGKISNETGGYETFQYRFASMPMGSSPPLYTGLLEVPLILGTKRTVDFEIIQESPLPFSIRAIVAEMSFGE